MSKRILSIDDFRLAFIVGVTVAAKTKADATKIFTDFNISAYELAVAENFKDAVSDEVKENKQVEKKPRAKKAKQQVSETAFVEGTYSCDDDEDSDFDELAEDGE